MKFLPLSQGQVAIIDDIDFEKVGHFKWCAEKSPSGNFYAVRVVQRNKIKTHYRLHCVILGVKGVDHIDGNGLDNRRKNLRPATDQQNHRAFRRKSPGKTSGFRGVSWDRKNLNWFAQIHVNDTGFNLGRFENEEDAARAYDKAAIKNGFFKEALNFP